MKVFKAVYNFIVGDMIILVGVIVTMIVLAILHFVQTLQMALGVILIVAVLMTLIATLSRETRGR